MLFRSRGTSTFDGLSIAWAVVEYISNPTILGAKTLFATHYHELTELEGRLDNVNNYCIAVKENGDDIVFLRKIIKGGADKSYGILVAKLAGVPNAVIERAKEIAEQLDETDLVKNSSIFIKDHIEIQKETIIVSEDKSKELDDSKKIIEQIKKIDITRTTPLEAMNVLYELQEFINDK